MESIKAKAFALLARKAYFSKQLRKKLIEKGFLEEEVAPLIDELKQRGWLNDEELAARYVEQQRQRGYGAKVIAFKLRERAGPVEVKLQESEEDLQALIQRRYKNKIIEQREKVIQSLLRRGHSYDMISRVLQKLVKGD